MGVALLLYGFLDKLIYIFIFK